MPLLLGLFRKTWIFSCAPSKLAVAPTPAASIEF
jgi:hypothetical protein